ncbi:MAG: ribonuclease III [Gammaproteobacteria bacterium]|nr:ribonuclease III [Gammaproteobacteria bacterium]
MTADTLGTFTGYQFRRKELLEQALTHRSFSRNLNNERLEFLGDSILNLVISNHIYRQFDDSSEGDLSRIRASLVKQETLAEVARAIGLGDHIRLGGGELKSGGFRRASILSDALEALIAAIYLDSDYARTETVILHLFRDLLQNVDADSNLKDAKTLLQEYLQARQKELPRYTVEQTSGKSHSQVFTVSCELVDLELQSRGKGSSRKKAEQQAAQNILDRLGL